MEKTIDTDAGLMEAPWRLPDVLAPGLRIVFCGTAAGTESARQQAYYAGPGNRFWPILYKVGLTPRLLRPDEYPVLPEFGLGLTDLVKTRAGGDSSLAREDFDRAGFERKVLEYRPAIVCFNGKQAAKAFFAHGAVSLGLQASKIGTSLVFVAPSTSGAARGFWDESVWRTLARLATDERRDNGLDQFYSQGV